MFRETPIFRDALTAWSCSCSPLRVVTQGLYLAELQRFKTKIEEEHLPWVHMTTEQQDWWLAEWLVERFEDLESRTAAYHLLSALKKINLYAHYRTARKVLDVWSFKRPPLQAAALQPVTVFALSVLSILAMSSWVCSCCFMSVQVLIFEALTSSLVLVSLRLFWEKLTEGWNKRWSFTMCF